MSEHTTVKRENPVDERGSSVSGHDHAFEVPDGFRDPMGRDIDHKLLGQFTGAAFDGCQECQAVLMDRIAGDPAVTARLVELACMAVDQVVGGLPPSLTGQGQGLAAAEFQWLAAAGADGNNDAMFTLAETMTTAERRAAMETAANLLVGFLPGRP